MDLTSRTLTVPRGQYELHAEMTAGIGVPVVLMHGFPDNTHLYDRLLPHLAGAPACSALRLPRLGPLRQARGISLHGNQPGRRPSRRGDGHRRGAGRQQPDAGRPRRLRSASD
jgi:hypothetical protein